MPVIKRFSKKQNINIFNILQALRRRFRTVVVDFHVPETVPRYHTKRVCCTKCHLSWYDLNETFLHWSYFLFVGPISDRLQPTFFARNDWLFGKQLFYDYQDEKHHNCYLLMSASQWPCKHVLIGDYCPNPDKRGSRYYRTCYDKAAYIISQVWLWFDS